MSKAKEVYIVNPNHYKVICNLKGQLEEKDKEIERLTKIEKKYQKTNEENKRLKRLVQKKYYNMKDKLEVVNIFDELQNSEIERLNNIIKKLENYLLDMGIPKDYLKELKDSDK